MKQKTCIQPKYQHLSTQRYLQGLSKSFCACIADLVSAKVEAFDGSVYLRKKKIHVKQCGGSVA